MSLSASGSGVALLEVSGVLLGLLLLLTFLARRARAGGPARSRGVVTLTGQHTLHVVEIAGKRLIVGTGPAGAPRLLCELPPLPSEERDAPPPPQRPRWSRSRGRVADGA